MRTVTLCLILSLGLFSGFGQTKINKSIPCSKGQVVKMHSDYPELIKVTTWEGSEVVVEGSVSINNGENDDSFLLEVATKGNVISIDARVKDINKIPQRVTIVHDGQKMTFKNKAELKKYQEEHGFKYDYMNQGADMEIVLLVKVPRNVPTTVESVYGMVEVKGFEGPLTVQSTYGGVDAALAENMIGEITAETNFGQIFTNLSAKFSGDSFKQEDFHTEIQAKIGNGPDYSLESKYGNVYIRKLN